MSFPSHESSSAGSGQDPAGHDPARNIPPVSWQGHAPAPQQPYPGYPQAPYAPQQWPQQQWPQQQWPQQQWPQQQWPGYQPPPARRPPSRRARIVTWLLVATGAGVIVGFLGFLATLSWNRFKTSPPAPRDALTEASDEADREAIRKAFSTRPLAQDEKAEAKRDNGQPGTNDHDLVLIQAVLSRWSSLDDENMRTLEPHFDAERFAAAMTRSPYIGLWSQSSKDEYRRESLDFLEPPGDFDECRLIDVRWSADRNEAVVYCYLRDEDAAGLAMRCWVARHEERFRIYDWEFVERRRRESDLYAAIKSLETTRHFSLQNAYAAWNDYEKATEEIEKGSFDAAKSHLARAEGRALPETLSDWVLIDVADGWQRTGEAERSLKVLERIGTWPKPDPPTVFLMRSIAYTALERHEEALAELDKLATTWGLGPETDPRFAQAAATLDRKELAIESYRKFLDLFPNSPEALASFCELLEDEEAPKEVAKRLPRCKDPRQAAMTLVDGYYDDPRQIDAVIAFLAKRFPDSAEISRAEGWKASAAGDYATAAERFREAVGRTTDEGEKELRFQEYLDAMMYDERALDAYRTAENPASVFAYFTDLQIDDANIDQDDWRQIVDSHLEKYPDDRRGLYWRGQFLLNGNDVPAARAELEKSLRIGANNGEDTEDDEMWLSACRSALYLARHLQDETMAAYEESNGEAFYDLAYRLQEEKNGQLLGELVEAHAKRDPSDVWIDDFRLTAAMLRKDYSRAIELGLAAYKKAEGLLRNSYHDRVLDALLESAGPIEALRRSPEPTYAFDHLARKLANDERWNDLEALVVSAESAEQAPPSPAKSESEDAAGPGEELDLKAAALPWRIKLLSWKGDHEAVFSRLTPWPQETIDRLPSHGRQAIVVSLIRAYNHTGDRDAALAWCANHNPGDEDRVATLAILAAVDRPEELLALIDKALAAGESVDWLSRSVDLAPMLAQESFAKVRLRIAPPLWRSPREDSYSLLLAERVEISAESLRDALAKELGPEVRCENFPLDASSGESLYLIRSPSWNGSISLRSKPYLEGEQASWRAIQSSALLSVVSAHQAAIEVKGPFRVDGLDEAYGGYRLPHRRRTEAAITRRIVLLLAEPSKCLAFHAQVNGLLFQNNAAAREALAAEDAIPRLIVLGERLWSPFLADDAPERPIREAADQRTAKKNEFLAAIESDFKQGDASPLEVQVEIRRGPAVERLRLKLQSVDERQGESWSYVCETISPSALRTDLPAGKLVRISADDLIDFRKVGE